jgi:STE24 endopeptidase
LWAAGLAVAAGAWLFAASRLWHTQVPGDLHISGLNPADYFTPDQLRKSAAYERFLRVDFVLSQIALVAVLGLYAVRGDRFTRESAAGRIGTGMLLGMLGFALVWMAELPFGIAELWWQRRHHISREGYISWAIGDWLGLAGQFLFVCLAILIVMALAGPLRRRWWVLGGPAFTALALLFAFIQPYLISGVHPLRKPAVAAEARKLARSEALPRVKVEVQDVHRDTTAPNAEAVGIGPSRRVLLWDTVLDGRFSLKQLRVLIAHELGHLHRNHILKGVLWFALFALPGAYLVAAATRRRGGMYDARSVPLALFVVIVLQIVLLPVQNVISRRVESEADWVALQTTRDPASARALFQRLATTSRTQPRPPTWSYLWLDDHPTIIQRIALANAWQSLHRTAARR